MTSQLGAALRDLGDTADPQALPAPGDLRAAGDLRRRRTTMGVAAGCALAGAGAVWLVTAVAGPQRQPDPVTPLPGPTSGPTASPTASPAPSASAGPAGEHPIATSGLRFSARAVAVRDGRFVVVGDSSSLEEETGPPVYWSDDGVTWHPPAEEGAPATVNVTDVVATPDGFLAVGTGRAALAWRSDDGRTWVESAVEPAAGSSLWGVTGTSLGYYAWGFRHGVAHLWRSPDGRAWSPVADESVFDLAREEAICAVREGRGGLVATGVGDASRREGRAVTWTSADGATWTLAESPGEPALWCDPTQELGHWTARSDAGEVAIDPYGEGDTVTLTPPAE